MALAKYTAKRNLKVSKEPRAKLKSKKSKELIFVIQEHHARQLHYDLRLELGGVLKSWAVPKEPSLDPAVKRLAIMVEDHPYDYKDFEGTIPEGYGAGTVKIWDRGTYSVDGGDVKATEKAIKAGLKKGSLHFALEGKRLHGIFHLVKLKNSEKNEWLLIKKKEEESQKSAGLTHLDKVYWKKEKITKGEMIDYYASISKWLLPYLKDKPESLRRFPNGTEGEAFFQKDLKGHPDWIQTAKVEHSNKKVNYLLIQNKESLLYAANLGCIELHPFFSKIDRLHNPDYMVFDLDPKTASFDKVIEVAKEIHAVLEEIKVPSFCKTSGRDGLHIAIPLGGKYTYENAKGFAEVIALIVMRRLPKIATMERSIAKRKGKVYIDCNQNNFGQTLVAAYSVRARPGATVSTPLKWSEVKKGLDPKKFTIKNTLKRVKKLGDLFLPVLGKGIDMAKAIKRLQVL